MQLEMRPGIIAQGSLGVSRPPLNAVEDVEADLPACLLLLDAEPPNARINAREKLTRLSKQQFHELSTDVYDELVRRRTDDQASGARVGAFFSWPRGT